jgi:hypothetical protein
LNPISNCLPSFFFPLNRVLLQPLRDFFYLAQIEPSGSAFALSKNRGQEGVLKITNTAKKSGGQPKLASWRHGEKTEERTESGETAAEIQETQK